MNPLNPNESVITMMTNHLTVITMRTCNFNRYSCYTHAQFATASTTFNYQFTVQVCTVLRTRQMKTAHSFVAACVYFVCLFVCLFVFLENEQTECILVVVVVVVVHPSEGTEGGAI